MDAWNIGTQLDELRAQGLWRELRPLDEVDGVIVRAGGREWINFSSNDYLGLAGSSEICTALEEGTAKYGGGSGASRLVCGTHRVHVELEEALADFKGTEAALSFSSRGGAGDDSGTGWRRRHHHSGQIVSCLSC